MQSKLTLSMEKELIDFAHSLAKKSNISISQIFRTFLLNIKSRQKNEPAQHRVLQELYGICKSSPVPDKKKMYKKLYKMHFQQLFYLCMIC